MTVTIGDKTYPQTTGAPGAKKIQVEQDAASAVVAYIKEASGIFFFYLISQVMKHSYTLNRSKDFTYIAKKIDFQSQTFKSDL